MKTRAVRLHGANDLRLDEFELPPIHEDEILAEVITDSICMSTYNGNGFKFLFPFRHCLKKSCSFCTICSRIAGIFHIAPCENATIDT